MGKTRNENYISPAEARKIGEVCMSGTFKIMKWIAIGCGFLFMFTMLLIPVGIPFILFKTDHKKAGVIYIIVLLAFAGIYYLIGMPGIPAGT